MVPHEPTLFPLDQYWWLYAGFTLFVVLLLALDLGVFHRKVHTVRFREALGWTAMWVGLALVFDVALYFFLRYRLPLDARLMALPGFDPAAVAKATALEFLAGYVVEYSLSIDNIFVFVVVLAYFRIPAELQHRVLFFGILGALVFRGIFIAIGSLLVQYQWVLLVFGAFLVYTGFRVMFAPEKEVDPEKNVLIRLTRKVIPVTAQMHGKSFFTVIDGKRYATPLFVAVQFLELSDIVFAVDSVPAIFALTDEPFVVFSSNVFAILGLRNLYFMLRGAVDRFHLLKYGLGVVLIFVGLKMLVLNRLYEDHHFPIGLSLGIIIGVIGFSVVLSLLFPKAASGADIEEG
jgi:TerC family integral membrane protein